MNNIYISTVIWCAIASIISVGILILLGIIRPWSNLYVVWIIDLTIIYSAFRHITAIKKLPFCKPEDVLRIRHHRIITLELPLEEVIDLVFNALEHEGNSKITIKDIAQGRIQGVFLYYYTFWKVRILDLNMIRFEFLLKVIANRKTECSVSIWPNLYISPYDEGYNLEKAESIISYLKAHAQ